HAGLDLRTGGVGKNVKAPAAGSVSRVRCSPSGYGKAVYLTLDDGNTAVFGHLSEFAPALRDYVRQAQHQANNYTVNLEPPAGLFKFKPGDVIANSGDTGAGPAHLHYELRDHAGRPFNPRRAGVSWPDTTKPVLRKIVIVPHGPASLVNGDVKPVVLDCQPGAGGAYACPQVRASGRVGIGIDAFDPANNGDARARNMLGVYSVRTTANGRETFAIRFDSFSYEESRHEIVSYHPFLSKSGRFLLQWKWPGNACSIFDYPSDGWIQIGDQPIEIRVEAEDFFGNKAAVAFTVLPEPIPSVPMVPNVPSVPASSKPGSLEIDCAGTYLIVTARFPAPEPVAPILHAEGAIPPCEFRRVGQKTFRAAIAPASDAELLAISAEHPRLDPAPQLVQAFHNGTAGLAVAVADACITVKPDSPYGVLFLRAETLDAGIGQTPAPRRGTALRLWPEQTPINAPVDLSVRVPADAKRPDRLALYRRGDSKWEMLPTRREGGRLIASISEFGEFAL
ncbi:MAG: M23 family metallopeptidase, partial [Candidatus Hydrogenedentes bacterium]|nr:M23 family metallopeptidase [Candidatus Hydrogenedentota bacterium]